MQQRRLRSSKHGRSCSRHPSQDFPGRTLAMAPLIKAWMRCSRSNFPATQAAITCKGKTSLRPALGWHFAGPHLWLHRIASRLSSHLLRSNHTVKNESQLDPTSSNYHEPNPRRLSIAVQAALAMPWPAKSPSMSPSYSYGSGRCRLSQPPPSTPWEFYCPPAEAGQKAKTQIIRRYQTPGQA